MMVPAHFIKFSKAYALILLACIAVVSSLLRIGWIYPDSNRYLLLVSFFRGEILGTDLVSPFCYRPLLPLIAAVIPITPEITFAIFNIIFLIGLSWVILYITMEFNYSLFISFITSAVCTASWVVAYYGAAVLVDTGAMLFLGIGLLLTLREAPKEQISLVLVIGVLFKEIALIGGIAHFLYSKRREIMVPLLPIATYLILRFTIPSGNSEFTWLFHLGNFTEIINETIRTLVLTLGLFSFLIMIGMIWRRENLETYGKFQRWVLFVGLPSLGIFLLGLFFASFDARFVWPLYFAMIPIAAAGIAQIDKFLKISKHLNSTAET